VRQVADREHVQVGGYLALDPLWRCWSFTPEPNLRGRR
jgi:hypothetical protein